ncbi:hypothetical protein KXR63_00685 [Stutzerimonas chloritidismutans]|uniref:hypothetical protein n=1 Tax=Stutzerimonas chloritidismutans TaxID=203192 RepID=UPI003F175AE3
MGEALSRVLLISAALGISSKMAGLLPEPKPAKKQARGDFERLAAAEQRRARRRQRLIDINEPVMDHPRPEYETLFWPDMDAYHEAEARQEAAAMREVRRLVRPRVYRDILTYIKDCETTTEFSIVSEPGAERDKQEERGYAFGYAYVNQYCNGGYTGDSYAGWVLIPLNAGKFLKFHYSM